MCETPRRGRAEPPPSPRDPGWDPAGVHLPLTRRSQVALVVNGTLMTPRRKLIWTALLIAVTCAVVAIGVFVRPFVVAKFGSKTSIIGQM